MSYAGPVLLNFHIGLLIVLNFVAELNHNVYKESGNANDLELIKSKCLPILLYGLEACPLNKTSLTPLDFSVNRFFMKLFNTNDIQTVIECQLIFSFKLPSAIVADRSKTFLIKYDSCNNLLFKRSQLSL